MAELVTSEYFDQGDLEREQLHVTPSVSLDLCVNFCEYKFALKNGCQFFYILI